MQCPNCDAPIQEIEAITCPACGQPIENDVIFPQEDDGGLDPHGLAGVVPITRAASFADSDGLVGPKGFLYASAAEDEAALAECIDRHPAKMKKKKAGKKAEGTQPKLSVFWEIQANIGGKKTRFWVFTTSKSAARNSLLAHAIMKGWAVLDEVGSRHPWGLQGSEYWQAVSNALPIVGEKSELPSGTDYFDASTKELKKNPRLIRVP